MPLPGADPRPGIFGAGTIEELPRIVGELKLDRVLLVTGKSSFTASGAARVLPALRRVSDVQTWSDFSPNVDVDDVVAGVAVIRDVQPDGIVAIGGGSVLDMAKLLAAFLRSDPDEIPARVRSNRVDSRDIAMIHVPTTSGSGSEATHFAVAYIGQEKFSIADRSLVPDFVILDPDLTESASRYQRATSVIDAIAQGVESHWARSADETSRSFARAALAELMPTAAAFVHGDPAASAGAARGSHLAGRAIDLSKTTAAHAMAYGLTKRHGISHGHAVATTLGAFARLHAAATSPEIERELEQIASAMGVVDPDAIGDRLDGLATELGLELRLSALGVPRSDLVTLAQAVNAERLGNNPVSLTSEELLAVLEACW